MQPSAASSDGSTPSRRLPKRPFRKTPRWRGTVGGGRAGLHFWSRSVVLTDRTVNISADGGSAIAALAPVRWTQLVIGIVCMVMIANLQYGWTLFVTPIDQKYHWGRAAIQVAFTIFVLTETWLVPVEGWLVDRFGPKIVVFVGGVLVAIGWALNSAADTLTMLYAAAAIGGIGAGGVYGTCIGNALKWFPDRRGLAAGLTAAGFGAGSAL